MSDSARASESIWLEEPWRLAWLTPVAILLWAGLLLTFSLLLEQSAAPPPANSPVEARIIEIPPPTAGLRSNSVPAPAPAVQPKPRVQPAPKRVQPRPVPRPKLAPAPLASPSESGTAKREAAPAPPTGVRSGDKAEANDQQEEGGGGVEGTDNEGARATYAPVPEIPDDLRENIINTVAIAHFKVDISGVAEVSLAQPTDNPRLNEIILDTLKQWRFTPATRGGIAVESEFDIRIPITVQ
ncbi:MAG TPA: TonB family protein [Candidatus Binataceae bacterium]|nr:TonB family protein [Candidatus Binataceae bacterium]